MGSAFNSSDHRHAYVSDILNNLDTFIMNLTPNAWIGNVAEGWKIDAGNELPACSRQDHDLVRSILCDPVTSIDELGVVLRGDTEWHAASVKLEDQDTLRVSRQFHAAL